MKEKLTATITLGFIFSLFFYYKIVNPSTESSLSSAAVHEESVVEFSENIIQDDVSNINTDYSTNNSVIIETLSDNCDLNIEQTDELGFANAFKYYRNCEGSGGTFIWNDNSYNTLLKSDLGNESLLASDKEDNKSQKIDTKHLKLQNQLIGDNNNLK